MDFAHLRAFPTEELYRGVKQLEELEGTSGWEFLKNILKAQQEIQVNILSLRPKSGERADSYALRQAHTAGTVEAFEHAVTAPDEILRVARETLEDRQREAMQAALNERDT